MNQLDQRDILQSISSESDSQPEHESKGKKVQRKGNAKRGEIDDEYRMEYDIEDSMRINESIHIGGSNKKEQKAKSNSFRSSKSSHSSDFRNDDTEQNDDTQQLIDVQKNVTKESKEMSERKYQSKQTQIRYPEINIPPKIIQKPKRLQEKPEIDNFMKRNSQDNEEIDINISMIGERKPGNKKERAIKNQQPAPIKMKQNSAQKNNDNCFKSIYAQPGKPEAKKLTYVTYKVMDSTMYWIYDGKQLKVNNEIFDSLVEHFFQKQIMLPLITDEQFKSEHITLLINIFTEFMNQFYKDLFKEAFITLKNSAISGSKAKLGQISVSPKHSMSLTKNFYSQYIQKIFKKSNYSKAEILRTYIVKKLNMLELYRKLFKQNQNIRQGQKKSLQNQLGIIQLLVAFENAQNYCKANSTQGIDHKTWKDHGKKINEVRKNWIIKIEGDKKDFTFNI